MMNVSNSSLSVKPGILLLIAFIEGAVVMAAELIGAKMLAPFFGTTIYAWAAVLAITLLALATGYYTGGYFTTKHPPLKILRIILILSGMFMVLMPAISTAIMSALVDVNILPGLIIALMGFVFPPVFFFGMVSPVIIHTLVNHVDKTGSVAGKVYAISTLGGVLNTLLLGFYIMPQFGIKGPAIVYGLLILILPFLILERKSKPRNVIIILILASLVGLFQLRDHKSQSMRFSVLYASEGILGQVKVVDIRNIMVNNRIMEPRGLIVNNTWQTLYNLTDKENLLDYIYFIKPVLSKFDGSTGNSMLVGLGGGMLAREMVKTGMQVEAVEIDARLKTLARRYFDLDPSIDVIIDDGRHHINRTKKTYSLIILDAFLGENPPWHLLTQECFETIRSKLDDDGVLIIEFFGLTEGLKGRPARSILATLQAAGFDAHLIATRKEDAPDRNLIFLAHKGGFTLEDMRYDDNPYAMEPINDLRDYIIKVSASEMQDAKILRDNLPVFELMVGRTSLHWRSDLNKLIRDIFVEDDLPLFY